MVQVRRQSTGDASLGVFPHEQAARDRFIVSRRPGRPARDPWRAQGVEVEEERTSTGSRVDVATIFLTGRECPWRCTMCDLWQYTIDTDTPPGAIAAQVAASVATLDRQGDVSHVKLYNAGSFFDPRAVPPGDYPAVAGSVRRFDRVIVESHPSLVGRRTADWLETMAAASEPEPPPKLEVAMGLETVHPTALEHLNKRMTLDDFTRAADRLAVMGVDLRAFLLVSPPFVPADEQDAWLVRSAEAAFGCGATVVSLIPMRDGNGAVEALAADGQFVPPGLTHLERSLDAALAVPRPVGARVFADLWNLGRLATCPHCLESRRARLRSINLTQHPAAPVRCAHCGDADAA